MENATREEKVRRGRLTQAEKQPQKALDQGWFQDPAFCEGYFDRCENHALHISPDTLKLALKAVEIAVTNGDPTWSTAASGCSSTLTSPPPTCSGPAGRLRATATRRSRAVRAAAATSSTLRRDRRLPALVRRPGAWPARQAHRTAVERKKGRRERRPSTAIGR